MKESLKTKVESNTMFEKTSTYELLGHAPTNSSKTENWNERLNMKNMYIVLEVWGFTTEAIEYGPKIDCIQDTEYLNLYHKRM